MNSIVSVIKRCFRVFVEMSRFSTPVDYMNYTALQKIKEFETIPEVPLSLRQFGGAKVFCRPGTSDVQVFWSTFIAKYHLPPIKLGQDCVIVDMGANVGYTLFDFARTYRDARIIGVEMDRQNYELALKNIEPYHDRCSLINAAIWSKDGEICYSGDSEEGFAIQRQTECGDNSRKVATARSIGSIFREFNLTKVDFVKMDIEGAEAEVFDAPMEWTDVVGAMNIEVHGPADIETIMRRLEARGFRCTKSDTHWSSIHAVRR